MSGENQSEAVDLEAVTLSVPGKTFLVGEYLAIRGGPSLLLTTAPRFQLRATRGVKGRLPFAPGSPAALYIQKNRTSFRDWKFEFSDPHKGRGGLGASSAQFALLYYLKNAGSEFDIETLLQDYRACAWNGEGVPPSGADVVSQIVGGVTWFDGRTFEAEQISWDFPKLSFTLLRTGVKLATHEHLRATKEVPADALEQAVLKARAAMDEQDEASLIQAVASVGETLKSNGFLAEKTASLLAELPKDLALASKGCGAMGADVMLVLHERARRKDLLNWAREKKLETCGTDEDLGDGLLQEA